MLPFADIERKFEKFLPFFLYHSSFFFWRVYISLLHEGCKLNMIEHFNGQNPQRIGDIWFNSYLKTLLFLRTFHITNTASPIPSKKIRTKPITINK